MKHLPITLITPSYNQGEFIEKTIQSVLNQKYPKLEYIVIDGGSTDNTIQILKKYEKHLTWISEKDKGQADALNKGFKKATGDIIGYLCSDDLHFSYTLQTINEHFINNPSSKLVTGDYKIIDNKEQEIMSYIRDYKKLLWRINSFNTFAFANYVNQPSTFWRRELFDEFGYFDISLRYVFDYEWWLKVSKSYPIDIINKQLSQFRIHQLSKSGSQHQKQFKEDYTMVTRHTNNKLLLFMKSLHNRCISSLYSFTHF